MAEKRRKTRTSPNTASASDKGLEELLSRADLSCSPGLPICAHWEELRKAIRDNQVLIVSGETGSGKTTQLPKLSLLAGRGRQGKIVCTQPRRVAAVSVAARLAEEMGGIGPSLVGYRIRFKDRTGPFTRVQFVTDGLLLAELHRDRWLRAYDTVIVDEAHERSLNIDLLLGTLRKILKKRKDLKVIVTSATLDVERFKEAFPLAPHLEVAGRGFPVEILYRSPEEELDDTTITEQVLSAVEEIRHKDKRGDVLVFLPTERDIHETVKALKGTYGQDILALPMYGRLAGADQQRIFRPSPVQKIVVATNVAETSITVPGIRYVVDSGLARIARYNVRSRTKALPVSPISRASADQRAGRAGRVEPGICLRLYSQDDYLSRPRFTPPEILRSNLAEVILRLEAMGLGPVEDFPFIDPPSPQAVKEGYGTLRELGALSPKGRLTRLGRLMARLPLDPRISRMVIQARQENALREVIIIASALSIQDPRERPAEMESKADKAHQPFLDNSSDFLSFLKIWNAFHREIETGASKGRLRRFCKEHFLSYNRMQEWRDIHDQILSLLNEAGNFPLNPSPASYEAVHRSILSGFLGNLGMKQEGTRYLGTRGKELYLFPGSGLYKKRPNWIVAAELVRTTKLYARIAAMVDPRWVEEIARGLVTYSYSQPHWEKRRGEVVAFQKVSLWGLPIVERRSVGYGRISPKESREIFIRDGLAEGALKGHHRFLRHNVRLIEEVRDLEHRTRRRDYLVDPDVLYHFYDRGLRELEACLKVRSREKKRAGADERARIVNERDLAYAIRLCGDAQLHLTKDDLLKAVPEASELAQFPGHMEVADYTLPLTYRFSLGDEKDGVTITVPAAILNQLPGEPFEWLVPGLLEEKITALLKGLPKKIRKGLVPISDTARRLCALEHPREKSLLEWLEETLWRKYNVRVERHMWPSRDQLPMHLFMRFSIVDARGKEIVSGRDFEVLKGIKTQRAVVDDDVWSRLKSQWEKGPVDISDFPDLPEYIAIPKGRSFEGLEMRAYPGLKLEGKGKIYVRLFLSQDEAMEYSQEGLRALLAQALSGELDYIRKNCVPKGFAQRDLLPFGGSNVLSERIFRFLYWELLGPWKKLPNRQELTEKVASLRGRLVNKAHPLISLTGHALRHGLEAREVISRLTRSRIRASALRAQVQADLNLELQRLLPPDFPIGMNNQRLKNLPRYLKALTIRAERADTDPNKDAMKARKIARFLVLLQKAEGSTKGRPDPSQKEALEQLGSLLDEYRVSVFAPELGTAIPVSEKKIQQLWDQIRSRFSI